jgi:hypothetical protein
VNTALEHIGISSNWARKIRGRKVRGEESPYSQPSIDALRAKFKEAVQLLQFTSEAPEVPKEVQERLRALQEEQEKLKAQYFLRSKTTARKPKSDCADGNCQKIVAEEELESLLSQGYHFVATLPSGKVVISND